MTLVYKILARAEWERAVAAGRFEGSAIDLEDGYIHLSDAAQAEDTARRHFQGQSDLLLIAIPAEALGGALTWGPSRGGALFPHLYGPLDPSLAVQVRPLTLGADGAPLLGTLEAGA